MTLRSNLATGLCLVAICSARSVDAAPPASSPAPASPPGSASAIAPVGAPKAPGPQGQFGPPPALAVMMVMDLDHDGGLSSSEISQASESLADLDKNHDGDVGAEELKEEVARKFPARPMHQFGFGGPRGGGPGGPRGPGPGPGSNGPPNFHGRPDFSAPLKRFTSFDKNNDEKISADELPSTIAWLVNDFDANHNGEMDSSEIGDVENALFEGKNGSELRKKIYSDEALSSETIEQLKEKSRDFLQRAQQNQQEISAERRRSQIGYCVNVCVMFLSVVAFGHLLASHPPRLRGWREINADPEANSAVVYSVMFTSALAALDLVWTLTSSQNNHFRELNPVGSLMLAGASLPLFRLLTISLSATLFVALRRYRGAQVGSWWMCLVYILVTWRWFLTKSIIAD